MTCVDIGPSCPSRVSFIERQRVVIDMEIYRTEADEELVEIEDNLHRLTVGITNISTDDLPRSH